ARSLVLVLVSCLAADTVLAASDAERRATMQGALAALVSLQPFVASPAAFSKPENAAEIGRLIDALAAVQHTLPREPDKALRQEEPGLVAITNLFSTYLKDTSLHFRAG